MDSLLFVVMFVLIIFIGIKNVSLIKRYRQNKEYIEVYQKTLMNEEDAYDAINKYIENEKSNEFKNKARLIKIYCCLNSNIDYSDALNELDLKAIFYKKGSVDNSLVRLNTDSFIFMMLSFSKAYANKDTKVIEDLDNKLKELSGLDNQLEYKETIDMAEVLLNKSNDMSFFNSLLEGTYSSYVYEKKLIGLFKRIASTMLAFKNQQFDEYFRNDLHSFAKSKIGENLLKNLGLYETYKPIVEESLDVNDEEVKEIKEEEKN